MPHHILLEVCCNSPTDAVAAAAAGADRIELCAALELGGLTPSLGTILETLDATDTPVIVMIRPRGGGFGYAPRKLENMEADVLVAVTNGAHGIVFGILNDDHTVNVEACSRLVKLAGGSETVFHRAFDFVSNPHEALEQLIDCGVTRVLTSGQRATAAEGASLIKELQQQAAGRIEILPGGGITPENIAATLAATGCTQVHVGGSTIVKDPQLAPESRIQLRDARITSDAEYRIVDRAQVQQIRNTLIASPPSPPHPM